MIRKVISGGQIGADIAGLRAAKKLGIPTGGWATTGWRTKSGPNPELGSVFGLKEFPSENYRNRTFKNVEDSDGTIRLAVSFLSPGERCTMNAILHFGRPSHDVPLVIGYRPDHERKVREVQDWIIRNEIEVLNVAGNGRLDIEHYVEEFLIEVLKDVSVSV